MTRAPRSHYRLWRSLRPLGDLAAAALSIILAFWLRVAVPFPWTLGLMPASRLHFLREFFLLFLALQPFTLYFFGLYDRPQAQARLGLVRRLSTAVLAQGATLTAIFFLADRTFPRSVLVVYVALDFSFLLGWRLLLQRHFRQPRRRVAIVGRGAPAREIMENINRHRWHGLEVVGLVEFSGEGQGATADADGPDQPLGSIEQLPELLQRGVIDDIILTSEPGSWQNRLLDSLAGARPPHSSVLLVPGPFESLIGRMRYRWVHDIPLIEVIRESEWQINRPLKRAFDLVLGTLLLILALPLLAVVALVVRLTSAGPVFFRQERIGENQRLFTLIKIRTMTNDAEGADEEVLATKNDPRLTRIGAWLRRFRLDELPQLVNVLRGEMSLVGPRPERPGFVAHYLAEVPGYGERFSVAPGLTGLAQVNGEYDSTAENKLRYDLAYIANWSPWLDLSIFFRTIKIVLTSRGL